MNINYERTYMDPVETVILLLLKQKTLAKDMHLPFARSLEGFNTR
jgi:hypothetical protein